MSAALDRVIRAAEAHATGNPDCIAILGACAELRSESIALTNDRKALAAELEKWIPLALECGAELARVRAICNAMPPAAADGPGISVEEAQDHLY